MELCCGNADCRTQVADAMMTCPVLALIAMTDHDAQADDGASNKNSAHTISFMAGRDPVKDD